MKSKTVKIVQPEIDPVPVEILATAIRDIAKAMKRIDASGLTRRGIALLVADCSGVNLSTVARTLSGLDRLEREFISKPTPKL